MCKASKRTAHLFQTMQTVWNHRAQVCTMQHLLKAVHNIPKPRQMLKSPNNSSCLAPKSSTGPAEQLTTLLSLRHTAAGLLLHRPPIACDSPSARQQCMAESAHESPAPPKRTMGARFQRQCLLPWPGPPLSQPDSRRLLSHK